MLDFQHDQGIGYFTDIVNRPLRFSYRYPQHANFGNITTMLADVLNRIQKRLDAVGLKESRAATIAGLSDSAIRNMRRAVEAGKDRGASIKTLEKLAPVLGTNVTWLMEGIGNEEGSAEPASITDVPLISWISAGELTHQDPVGYLDDHPTIPAVNLPIGEWIALRVDGPSMNKISPPDSIIFINTQDKRLVANGCYVICDETGKATYKRYRPNETPQFQPASYQEIDPPILEGAITVIGRVKRSVIDM
ncbi:LexA family protein [Ochrobactrum quorumnocens]|uniref:LexA family protein n=1 Tax=Ochrobactrum quorumnocens TaxID=271865 RepID=UPI001F407DC2|nr:S24 family peptidase [[Ochrobactrum] quorumnocens]